MLFEKNDFLNVLFTSTSFMTGTGLKKWSPPNLSFLSVFFAMSVIGKEDVLLAKIVELKSEKSDKP